MDLSGAEQGKRVDTAPDPTPKLSFKKHRLSFGLVSEKNTHHNLQRSSKRRLFQIPICVKLDFPQILEPNSVFLMVHRMCQLDQVTRCPEFWSDAFWMCVGMSG